jgi:hypothetical protein
VWRAAPDVVIAFHAGFWGYDSWRPTLMGLLRTSIPVVATSYTMEEARLDVRALGAATLEAGASDDAADAAAAALDFLWGPEENERAGARRVVASAPPGHDYRENNVSFCFRGRPDPGRRSG